MHARKCACEKCTLVFKPKADATRSPKQMYQWPHEKDKMILKNAANNISIQVGSS